MEEEEWNFKDWWKDYRKIAVPTFIALILIVIVIGLNYSIFVGKPTETRGTFGDMFGVSNAIFSALAFVGIIVTIFLQSQELKEQREELKLTRKEFNQQNETLSLQRFENTFFQLLGVHHSIVVGMEIGDYAATRQSRTRTSMINTRSFHTFNLPSYDIKLQELSQNTFKGRAFFKTSGHLLDIFMKQIIEFEAEYQNTLIFQTQAEFNNLYQEIYLFFESTLGVYYRNLYRIIKLIDESEFISKKILQDLEENNGLTNAEIEILYELENNTKRYKYTSMIRAQLSEGEIKWLCFNGLSTYGVKFKPLIEKYSLLKNFPEDNIRTELMDDENGTEKYYRRSAFLKDENENIKINL